MSKNISQIELGSETYKIKDSDARALINNLSYGSSLSISEDASTYNATISLIDQNNKNLSVQTIGFPKDSYVSCKYNDEGKAIELKDKNGIVTSVSLNSIYSEIESVKNDISNITLKDTMHFKGESTVDNIKNLESPSKGDVYRCIDRGIIDDIEINAEDCIVYNGTYWSKLGKINSDIQIAGVNDSIITIQQNGVTKGQFSLNQATSSVINLGGGSVPKGIICMWSGNVDNVPEGWHLCDGTDGTPDLRDKFIVGAGNTYYLGQKGGNDSIQLNIANMPSHSHTTGDPNGYSGETAYAGEHYHSGSSIKKSGAHSHRYYRAYDAGGRCKGSDHVRYSAEKIDNILDSGEHTHILDIVKDGDHGHKLRLNKEGSNVPIDIRPKFYALALIIKVTEASQDTPSQTDTNCIKCISDFETDKESVGTFAIYTGTTNSKYTRGFIYEKKAEKAWANINVQNVIQ